jgi:hypothetical protein
MTQRGLSYDDLLVLTARNSPRVIQRRTVKGLTRYRLATSGTVSPEVGAGDVSAVAGPASGPVNGGVPSVGFDEALSAFFFTAGLSFLMFKTSAVGISMAFLRYRFDLTPLLPACSPATAALATVEPVPARRLSAASGPPRTVEGLRAW